MYEQEVSPSHRPLRISSPLEANALLMTDWQGAEALSEPFRFTMNLVSEVGEIDFAVLLGAAVTITVDLPGEDDRVWNGIITEFQQRGQDEDFTHYAATVEPSLALLRMSSNYRIFQDKSVDDIVDFLLQGLVTKKLYNGTRMPRNYCVQYGETDLQFFHRLLEEQGLFYFFEHQDGQHTLVLCDESSQLSATRNLGEIDYSTLDGGVQDQATISRWQKRQQLIPSQVRCRDTHFQLPKSNFESARNVSSSTQIGSVKHTLNPLETQLEAYHFPGSYSHRYDSIDRSGIASGDDDCDPNKMKSVADDAEFEARLQTELLANLAISIDGSGNVLPFKPGGVFSLCEHFDGDGDYLLVRVEHHVELGIGLTSAGGDDSLNYRNRFSCLPAEMLFRTPRRNPKPIVPGVQTATVVALGTAEDEQSDAPRAEQFYDKYGRIKVMFPWDQRTIDQSNTDDPNFVNNAADRSCWIRVAQVWAGNRWGAYFWPRAGHEVVVAFEHGDPDRPIVVGSVYNAVNMPPMKMPDQQALAGIKSCTVGGNPESDFNGITFYDERDNEHLEVQSQAHATTHSEQSEHRFVRGTSVRVNGSLFDVLGAGSGSGGGPPTTAVEQDEKETDDAAIETINFVKQPWSSTRKWSNAWLGRRFEADISVTLGDYAAIVGGFPGGSLNEVVQGGKLSLVMDPSGWIDSDEFQKIQDLLSPMGDTTGVFGSRQLLHYGSDTLIRHGKDIQRRSAKPFDASNPRTAWVGGIVTASSALTLLGWRLQKDDPKVWENLVRTLGPRGTTGILFNLLLEFEKANSLLDAGIEKQSEASSLQTHAGSLCPDYQSLVLSLAETVTDQGTALTTQGNAAESEQEADGQGVDSSGMDTVNAEEQDGDEQDGGSPDTAAPDSDVSVPELPDDIDGADTSFGPDEADVYECYDGLLATGARHVSLRARAAEDDDSDPSLIHLDAQGGEGEDNGAVVINSTGQASIVCGPASFQVRREGEMGQIDAATGPQGKAKVTCGDPDSDSRIVMDSSGIQLLVGDNLISMTKDGIKLSVGETSIELTASGAVMKCSSNSVTVDQSGQTTKGTNVTQQADVSFSAKGTMVSLEGDAQATVKGAITMIN